jgi:hypothetical protein
MIIRNCKRCSQEFKWKKHYLNHLQRINPCKDKRKKINNMNGVGILKKIDNSNIDDIKKKKCSFCGLREGHNIRTCPMNPDNKNEKKKKGKKGSNLKALNNEKNVEDNFNKNLEYYKTNLCKLVSVCEDNVRCKKVVKENGVKQENAWNILKEGTKERRHAPKTDICICNIENTICETISIKSGKGRYTSADCHETNAIFKSVYNNKYNNDPILHNMIIEIINLMKELGKKKPIYNYRTRTNIEKDMKDNPELDDEDTRWINRLSSTENKCNEIWKSLLNDNLEYIKDVLFECVSGEYKFGKNIGRANWLLVTENSHTAKIDKLFKLDRKTEELDKYLWNSLPKNPFKMKSGGTGKVMWIRFL